MIISSSLKAVLNFIERDASIHLNFNLSLCFSLHTDILTVIELTLWKLNGTMKPDDEMLWNKLYPMVILWLFCCLMTFCTVFISSNT